MAYRAKILPEQLERARRRYQMLLREAISGKRFDLLTPDEINALDRTKDCGIVPRADLNKGG